MGHILVPPSGDCWYLILLMGNTALLRMNQDTVHSKDHRLSSIDTRSSCVFHVLENEP